MGYFTSQLPRWASNADAVISPEPTEGKKGTGWSQGEKPAYQFFNWLQRRTFDCLMEVDAILGRALTWAAKHTFNAGLATPVAPASGNDVVNKTYSDNASNITTGVLPTGRIDDASHGSRGGGALHAAATGATAGFLSAADKTKLDAASSAPTLGALVQRDAAGRAQVASPSAAGDIANRGYVDSMLALVEGALAWGSSWADYGSGASRVKRFGGAITSVYLEAYASAGVANWIIATLPSGFRPSADMLVPCHFTHGTEHLGVALISGVASATPGRIQVYRYDSGGTLASVDVLTPASGNQVRLAFTFAM